MRQLANLYEAFETRGNAFLVRENVERVAIQRNCLQVIAGQFSAFRRRRYNLYRFRQQPAADEMKCQLDRLIYRSGVLLPVLDGETVILEPFRACKRAVQSALGNAVAEAKSAIVMGVDHARRDQVV